MDLKLPKTRIMVQNARLGKRALAFVLDLLLIELVIVTPFAPLFPSVDGAALQGALAGQAITFSPLVYSLFFCILVLAWLYFSIFQFRLAQTPGMMLMRISLEGERSLLKSLIRNLFVFPVFPFFLLWIIEPVMLMFRRRTWLEQVTGVRTVERIPLV